MFYVETLIIHHNLHNLILAEFKKGEGTTAANLNVSLCE